MPARMSVIIPAHNEEKTIGRALRGILQGDRADQLEIIVVPNGCTDSTAKVVRDVPGVTLVEVAEPSKTAALNAGDGAAHTLPRAYVDADVSVSQEALLALADVLSGNEPMVAAPRLALDTSRSGWLAREYYKIWQLTDYRTVGHVGSGIYALNASGRARFGAFPDLIADDRYVQRLFAREERVTLLDHSFTVEAPRTFGMIILRGTRIAVGNQQLAELMPQQQQGLSARKQGLRKKVLRRPSLWVAFAVYSLAFTLIQRRAKAAVRSGARVPWNQDTTTRT